jgi:DNA mismatch endonuclease (patch repair protein)
MEFESTPAVRRKMSVQRRRDTKPEVALRRALHRRGLRYRLDSPPLPGIRRSADIVFRSVRVAVSVDGCFWHGCPTHGHTPKSNSWYWAPKLERNRQRDINTDERLVAAGWLPIRVWEHEDASLASQRVAEAVAARQRPRLSSSHQTSRGLAMGFRKELRQSPISLVVAFCALLFAVVQRVVHISRAG